MVPDVSPDDGMQPEPQLTEISPSPPPHVRLGDGGGVAGTGVVEVVVGTGVVEVTVGLMPMLHVPVKPRPLGVVFSEMKVTLRKSAEDV